MEMMNDFYRTCLIFILYNSMPEMLQTLSQSNLALSQNHSFQSYLEPLLLTEITRTSIHFRTGMDK